MNGVKWRPQRRPELLSNVKAKSSDFDAIVCSCAIPAEVRCHYDVKVYDIFYMVCPSTKLIKKEGKNQ